MGTEVNHSFQQMLVGQERVTNPKNICMGDSAAILTEQARSNKEFVVAKRTFTVAPTWKTQNSGFTSPSPLTEAAVIREHLSLLCKFSCI